MPDTSTDDLRHLHPARLIWSRPADARRTDLERYVSDVYATAYGARLQHFHDLLMGLVDGRDELMGVIGVTLASARPYLFVEQYLDAPIEDIVAHATRRACTRDEIVEVGNLASRRPGTGPWLVSTLAHALDEEGRRFAVFAATTALRNGFLRLGVASWDLGPAEGARLGDERTRWGRYYETLPRVLVMDVAGMCRAAAADDRLVRRLSGVWSTAREAGRVRAGERASA